MSLQLKTERAFQKLLVDGVVGCQVLTGHESQLTVPATRRVIVNAEGGPTATWKSRNIRNRVIIIVERSADKQSGDQIEPADDLAALVLKAHQILDDNPISLATRLAALGGFATIGDFSCFGTIPLGEIHMPPEPDKRVLRNVWGYTATVAECIAT